MGIRWELRSTIIATTAGSPREERKETGVVNKRFGTPPLTADFNGDSAPDIVHVKLTRQFKVFLRKSAPNNYIKGQLPNTIASVGALVKAQ